MANATDASPSPRKHTSASDTATGRGEREEKAASTPGPRIVAMLPVRNEADRYLSECLEGLSRVASTIVVLDDASTDATPEVCARYPKVVYHRLDEPLFTVDESQLRHRLWTLAAAQEPDWILALDADECFEAGAEAVLPLLCDQQDYDVVSFRLFDLWGSVDRVRVDGAWNPWNRYVPLLARYDPRLDSAWPPVLFHCGRWPKSYRDRITFYSHLRVRHLGWADAGRHRAKYAFYRERDLAVRGQIQPHTTSILEDNPTLERWVEGRVPPFLSAGS